METSSSFFVKHHKPSFLQKDVDKSTTICYNVSGKKLTGKHLQLLLILLIRSTASGNEREVKGKLESLRFEKFTLLIDGIHKCINKIKFDTAPYLGVKSVHVFWVYRLYRHPEGLTAAEIASTSMVDRSLVSREIEMLKKNGYVSYVIYSLVY